MQLFPQNPWKPLGHAGEFECSDMEPLCDAKIVQHCFGRLGQTAAVNMEGLHGIALPHFMPFSHGYTSKNGSRLRCFPPELISSLNILRPLFTHLDTP